MKEDAVSDLSIKKIEQSINDRKKLHLSFLNNVKTYKPLLELEEKAFSDGALGKKNKRADGLINIDSDKMRTLYGVAS